MKTIIDIVSFWKWRKIYKAKKFVNQIGKLSILKKKYEQLSQRSTDSNEIKVLKAKHKEVSEVLRAKLSMFNFK